MIHIRYYFSREGVLMEHGMVGRIKEIAIFRKLLGDVLSGEGRVVLMYGDAGTGKTLLAERFAEIAGESGFAVMKGCWRENSQLPEYRGLSSLLESIAVQAGESENTGDAFITPAEFISGMKERFSLNKSATESTDIMQLVYYYAVKLLENISREKPCMVVLENIDFAGSPTLLFLENIIHEFSGKRFLFLLTYRPVCFVSEANEIFPVISGLKREKSCTEIALSPFSFFETEQLLTLIAGAVHDEKLISKIFRKTGGNPFLVREAAFFCRRCKEERRIINSVMLENEMPAAAAGLIGRRLSALGRDCVEMIKKASVIGESFTLAELKVVCEEAGEQMLQKCLETASAGGFLSYSASSSSFSFTHTVIHSSILSMVPVTLLHKLNRTLAESAEKEPGEMTGEKALKLACWWKKSGDPGAAGKAGKYLELAGDIALREGYRDEAADIYEKLVDDGLEHSEREISGYEASILLKIGRAKFMTGSRVSAIPALRKAFIYYKKIKEIEKMTEIVILPGYLTVGESGFFDFYKPLLELLENNTSVKSIVLTSYAYNQISNLGDYEKGSQNFKKVLAMSDACGDELSRMRAMLGLMFVEIFYNRLKSAEDYLEKASGYICRNPDCLSEGHIYSGRMMIKTRYGKYREAENDVKKLLDLSEKMNDSFFVSMACYHKSRIEQMEGRWVDSSETIDRGLNANPSNLLLLASKVFMEYATGNYEEGDFYRKRILAIHRRTPSGPYLAHLHAASTEAVRARNTGNPESLKQWVSLLKSMTGYSGCHPFIRIRAQLLLFFYAYLLNEPEIVREKYSSFSFDYRCNLIRPYVSARFCGLAEYSRGNYSRAAALLEKALSSSVFIGDRPLSAWINFELQEARYAETSISSGGDPEKKLSIIRRNLALCRENASSLGLEGLEKRILNFIEKTGSLLFSASGAATLLSAREKEILSLLAAGFTNYEIAERAGISFNTVANHVKNILRKTGASNRTQAASFAREGRLIQD